MGKVKRVRRYDQPAARLASKFGDSLLDFGGVANRGRRAPNCHSPWRGFERTQVDVIMGSRLRVEHEYGASNGGGGLFEYLQPLPDHLEIDEHETGDVPARMRQARNETLLDGIVDRRHHDGNGACRLPQSPDDWRRVADDYVRRERH